MKKLSCHIGFIFLCSVLLFSCNGKKAVLPDLREKYGYKNAKPFGAEVAHRILSKIYPGKVIQYNKKPFATFYKNNHFDPASFYFNVSNKFYVSDEDAQSILDFVYDGNTAFISSSVIDTVLMSKIYCKQYGFQTLPFAKKKMYETASASLLPDEYSSQDQFSYYYQPFDNFFSEIHSDRGRITGYNQNGKPNFIVFFWGKGRLYLHCEPRAFSNYFLLTKNNYLYMTQVMQLMDANPGKIFWDDYYSKINYREEDEGTFSSLETIMKYPALATAFWICLLLMLLYILFGMKRKQRVVPVVHPVKNTSIAFAEAVAGVYLSEKSNKNISDKMISYFNEYVRSRYFLNAHASNTDFITSLSKKSGVDFSKVQALYATINRMTQSKEITDDELMGLNEQIEFFYKK